MTLSPFEVERQEFARAAMGYKRSEVDGFLDEIRHSMVGLWQERADLREENERLSERVARFTALEEQLKNTLLLAQDSAEKATEQARREAELLMREAGQKAREIVHAAHEERQRLEAALRELHTAEQETRQRFRVLAQTVVQHLDDSQPEVSDSATTLRAIVHGSNGTRRTASRDVRTQGESARQRDAGIERAPRFDPSLKTPGSPSRAAEVAETTSGRQPVGTES